MSPSPYYIFYDGRCRLCTRSKEIIERMESDAELRFIDVQKPASLAQFSMIDRQATQGQMFVLDPKGRRAGGYDALVLLAPAFPMFRPISPLLRLRPIRALGRKVYHWIARNRYRLAGQTCESGICHQSTTGVSPVAKSFGTGETPVVQ